MQLFREALTRVKEIGKPKEKEIKEYGLNAEAPKLLRRNLTTVLENHFGKYGFTLVIRYWGQEAIRHSVDPFRPRTLPLDILADIQYNIDQTQVELNSGEHNDETVKALFRALVVRLRELLFDHLVDHGKAKQENIHYDVTAVHDSVDACLNDFETKLALVISDETNSERRDSQ